MKCKTVALCGTVGYMKWAIDGLYWNISLPMVLQTHSFESALKQNYCSIS